MKANFSTALVKMRMWFTDHAGLADGLSWAAIGLYMLELWHFSQTQYSVLDEGLYLYKGWLFATGRYTPFQAYGPWTNQMPLAFLIPGWVELIFGPGLRTGRLFACALGFLAILALWWTARRLGGRWVAAGLVLAVLLNPAAARMVAMAASQGIVACLLAWTLLLGLGDDRANWQLAVAGLLAGTAVMVRINLLPVLPLFVLYVLWARGVKPAAWALVGELVIFAGVQLVYWPAVLQIWAKWLPFPFLGPWAPPPNIPTWNPDNPLGFRIASLFLVFRYHFVASVGVLAAWLFWPRQWKSPGHHKAAVFLSVLFGSLFILHAWASLGNEYCVFCFPTYTSFYSGVGLLLVALSIAGWNWDLPVWRQWLGAIAMLALLAGMAYSAEGTVENLLGGEFYKHLLSATLPWSGQAQIWQVLANKFRLEYGSIYSTLHAWFPMLLAVLLSLGLLAAAFLADRRRGLAAGLALIVIFGGLFSPSALLAGEYNSYDCPGNVVPGYEAVGAQLARTIPPGSTIYWSGYSPVTLLYLPGVRIYPAQLHGIYSLRISNDDDALLRYGWWNQQLAAQWLAQADFVLVEQRSISDNDWLPQVLASGGYQEVAVTGLQAACQNGSFFHVFRRK